MSKIFGKGFLEDLFFGKIEQGIKKTKKTADRSAVFFYSENFLIRTGFVVIEWYIEVGSMQGEIWDSGELIVGQWL